MTKKLILIFLIAATGKLYLQQKNTNEISQNNQDSLYEVAAKLKFTSPLTTAPVFSDGKIIAIEKDTISCIDTLSKVLWKHDISGKIISQPIISGNQLVYGSLNGDLVVRDVNTGAQIQSIGIDDSITTNIAFIEYNGSNELMMPKQSNSKSAIIFGTASGKVYCFDVETLQEYWHNFDTKGKLSSQLTIIENKALFARPDGFMYCIDISNGLLIWRWKEKEDTDFSNARILCDGKKVFAVSKDGQVYSIDLLLGMLAWKNEKLKALQDISLSNDKKILFIKSAGKKFTLLSSDKGKVIKEIKQEEEFDENSTPVIEDDYNIYFPQKGLIFSLSKKYKEKVLLNLGGEIINYIIKASTKSFIISTTTGTLLIIKTR
jgi:outer membrane protein assembly factor BamB